MRRGLIRLAVLALILSSTATRAKAAFITFEGQFNTAYNAPITRLGFDIGNPIGQEQHFHEIDSTQFSLPSNGTGILLNDRNTEIFVTLSGGGLFTLNSVDVATALNNSPAVGLTITGFLGVSQTGVVTLANLGTGYTTLSGAALGTVDRIVFDGTGGGGGFVLDNLNVPEGPGGSVATPLPPTLLAGFLGMGLLAGVRRFRRA